MNKPLIAIKYLIILGLLLLGFASITTCGSGGSGDGASIGIGDDDPCNATIVPQLDIQPRFVIKTFYETSKNDPIQPLPNTILTYSIRKEGCGDHWTLIAKDEIAYTEEDATFETTQASGARFNNSSDRICIEVSSKVPEKLPAGIYFESEKQGMAKCISYGEAKNKGVSGFDVPINIIHLASRFSSLNWNTNLCSNTVVPKLDIKATFKVKTFYQVGNETPQPLPYGWFYMWIFKRPCNSSQMNFADKWLNFTGEDATYEYTPNTSVGTWYTNSQDVIGITVQTEYIPTGNELPAGIASIQSANAEAVITYAEAKNSGTGNITKQVNLIHKAYRK